MFSPVEMYHFKSDTSVISELYQMKSMKKVQKKKKKITYAHSKMS